MGYEFGRYRPTVAIAFSGPMGSGKSHAAELTKKYLELHGNVRILPLAETLKKAAGHLCPEVRGREHLDATKSEVVEVHFGMLPCLLAATELYAKNPALIANGIRTFCLNKLPAGPITFGLFLQLLGTDCLRTIDKRIFIDAVDAILQIERPVAVLIPDVRNDNEAAYVRHELGGLCIGIHAPGRKIPNDGRSTSHASEAGVECVSHVVTNDFADSFWGEIRRVVDPYLVQVVQKELVENH